MGDQRNCALMLRFLFLLLFLLPMPGGAAPSSGGLLPERVPAAVLEPDQAFRLDLRAVAADVLVASFTVAPGHYMYRDRIQFELLRSSTSRIGNVEMPAGETKQDANFGDTQVLHNDFTVNLRLVHANAPPATLTVLASYQGCSEKGLCYAPIKKTLEVELPATANAAARPSSEQAQIKTLLQEGKLWLIMLGFFGFGLLLSLTPCVFPMIPILSSLIVGQGNHPGRLHTFNLSLAYTLGMALTYTLAGVAAGFSGHLVSNALQNPWALGFGALVMVLLALSMFGLYDLQLPTAFESRIVGLTNRFRGGRLAGVFAMGALSALIISPCVAAPLAAALLYIGQTHDVVQGGVALFALAMGMGVPLLLLGAAGSALLPHTGAWMNAVRNTFGVIMLGMAIWLIGPVIPPQLQIGLYAALLIGCAIALRALDSLPPQAGHGARLWKGAGIVALVCGAALLVGALAGSKNPLQPLAGLRAAATQTSRALPFQRIKTVEELDAALRNAGDRYVMLDFYADWCVSCKEYEQFTFRDPHVVRLLQSVVLLQADVTANSPEDLALLQRFGLYGPPGILFFDHAKTEITPLRVLGYQDAEHFLVTLNALHAYQEGTCAPTLAC